MCGTSDMSSRQSINVVKANAENFAKGKIHFANNSHRSTRAILVKLYGIIRTVFNIVTNSKHLQNVDS